MALIKKRKKKGPSHLHDRKLEGSFWHYKDFDVDSRRGHMSLADVIFRDSRLMYLISVWMHTNKKDGDFHFSVLSVCENCEKDALHETNLKILYSIFFVFFTFYSNGGLEMVSGLGPQVWSGLDRVAVYGSTRKASSWF